MNEPQAFVLFAYLVVAVCGLFAVAGVREWIRTRTLRPLALTAFFGPFGVFLALQITQLTS